MPKKPKHEDKPSDSRRDWAEDQKEHVYYYDDAHGYETYDPEEDEDDTETGGRDKRQETRDRRQETGEA